MKRFNALMFGALVLFSSFFTSCKKDENAPSPSVSFDNNATEGNAVGGSYTINGTAKAPGKLAKIQYYTVTTSSEVELSNTAVSTFSNDTVVHFSLTISNLTATTIIKVLVTDKNSVTASSNFTINVGSAATLNSYTATLYNGLWYTDSGHGAFIDLETGTTYSQTASTAILSATDQAKVDLLYWYGSSTTYTLASPDDATAKDATVGAAATKSWTTRNATKLKVVTITQAWDVLTAANIDSYATSFGTDTKITALTVGKIIAFQTVGGKNGLIKVDAVTGTNGNKTDNASLSIKIEQ